jgi:hypothetical protein
MEAIGEISRMNNKTAILRWSSNEINKELGNKCLAN